MNEFSFLCETEGVKREQYINKTVVPDLDDIFSGLKKSQTSKLPMQIMRKALADELIGDCPGDPMEEERQAEHIDALLKSAGKPGEKLRRMMHKGAMTLEEGMNVMLQNLKEFFTIS